MINSKNFIQCEKKDLKNVKETSIRKGIIEIQNKILKKKNKKKKERKKIQRNTKRKIKKRKPAYVRRKKRKKPNRI